MYLSSIAHRSHGPPATSSRAKLAQRAFVFGAAILLASWMTNSAHADLTISDGNSSFFWDTDATGTAGGANFVESFGGNDVQYAERWYLRWDGTTYNLAGATTQVGSGNMASVTFSGIANTPLQFEGFDVEISYRINDTGSQSHMHTSATITNLSGTAQNVTLFNYFDYDIVGSGGHTATATAGADGITINAVNPSAGQIWRTGVDASHYEIRAYAGLLNDLEAGIDNLADGSSPFGPGDFTGALQWDFTIDGNGSAVAAGTVLGTTATVPEPSMVGGLAVLTAGIGFVGLRRRRRTKAATE